MSFCAETPTAWLSLLLPKALYHLRLFSWPLPSLWTNKSETPAAEVAIIPTEIEIMLKLKALYIFNSCYPWTLPSFPCLPQKLHKARFCLKHIKCILQYKSEKNDLLGEFICKWKVHPTCCSYASLPAILNYSPGCESERFSQICTLDF